MAIVAGSNICGSLVSSGIGIKRCTPLLPISFNTKTLAPSLRYCRSRSTGGMFRVAAVHMDMVSGLYDIAPQIQNWHYFLSEEITEGPIELPPELVDPFAIPEASPLQVAASVVLTGLITVLLFRSIRRRTRKAKATKFRSSGGSVTEDARRSALALLNKAPEVETPRPSALQTLSGAAVAGVIALVLYKFTVTVEGGFSGKGVSANYSIRNLTITVRTIITGLCYLATFVFAANSIGLTLLSLQLALNIGTPGSSPPGDSGSSNEVSVSQSPVQETKELEDSTDEDSGSSA